jgi:hypothetical protein
MTEVQARVVGALDSRANVPSDSDSDAAREGGGRGRDPPDPGVAFEEEDSKEHDEDDRTLAEVLCDVQASANMIFDGDSLPPGDGGDGLGPLLGSLPPDVLREVLLPKLDEVSRACFALSAGACLRALKDAGLSWEMKASDLISHAAGGGHLGLLRYAHERGCPWTERTCIEAARGGHLECLQYAHEHGCPWDWLTCTSDASRGNLECVQYAHEHGCPWDEFTCSEAASYGKLECLQYAHEFGFPWDERTCIFAARHGKLECLQYAHEHGCPGAERFRDWIMQIDSERD